MRQNINYILITPAKNEEKDLQKVIDSVVNQTVLPKVWIIIDDGSTDRTSLIIQYNQNKYDFIKSIRLPEHQRDIYYHYAYVCRKGFEYAIQHCNKLKINFDYIGLLDADTILERNYFKKLFIRMEMNPNVGIASGGIYYKKNSKLIYEKSLEDFPRGTGRIWTKQCFIETGGYEIDPAMHTISNVKANIKGYETKQYREIIAIQTRKTSSIEGFWKSNVKAGINAYYLYRRPKIIFLNVLYKSIQYPFYSGLAFLIGYLRAYFKNEARIKNIEIINYFQNEKITDKIKKMK